MSEHERPFRVYTAGKHQKKVYFKTVTGARQHIKVPHGVNVSGNTARDLYVTNIQYGPRAMALGRRRRKKPEIPMFTKALTPSVSADAATVASAAAAANPRPEAAGRAEAVGSEAAPGVPEAPAAAAPGVQNAFTPTPLVGITLVNRTFEWL